MKRHYYSLHFPTRKLRIRLITFFNVIQSTEYILLSSPPWQILSSTKLLKSKISGIPHILLSYSYIIPNCKCYWLYHQSMSKICLLYHLSYHSGPSHHHLVNLSQNPWLVTLSLLLPLCSLYSVLQWEWIFLFKTFEWLLIVLRIKFKLLSWCFSYSSTNSSYSLTLIHYTPSTLTLLVCQDGHNKVYRLDGLNGRNAFSHNFGG